MDSYEYTPDTRGRFDKATQELLDALASEFAIVEIYPPVLKDGTGWAVAVCESEWDPFNCKMLGDSVMDAAEQLARWRGVDLPVAD